MRINFNLQKFPVENRTSNKNQFFTLPSLLKSDSVSFGSSMVDVKAKNRQSDLKMYEARMQSNPKMAFLYNPDISKKVREQMASENPTINTPVALAKNIGLNSYLPVVKWLYHDKFDYDLIPRTPLSSAYIDLEAETNVEFINFLREKLKNAIDSRELEFKYNMSHGKLVQLLQENRLKPLEAEYKNGESLDSYIFDLSDENNLAVLNEHKKLNPVPSEKYYKEERTNGDRDPLYVPVTYLGKLGYSSAVHLAELLRTKKLPGIYEKVQTPQGQKIRAMVDITPFSESEYILSIMRNSNPNIVSTSALAKSLDMRKTDLDEAIKNDELQIIGEYIFPQDSKNVLVNLSDKKTKDFVDKKTFENMLIQSQRKELLRANKQKLLQLNSPKYALRMQIVWALCPMTRHIASDFAKNDGYVSSIIAKNIPEEDLSAKEQVVLAKYRQRYWNAAGTDEYKAAHQKASEYIELYKSQGIDAIDNPKVRAIFKKFEANK